MYTPEWVAEILDKRSILDVSLKLRMAASGAGECCPDPVRNYAKVIRWKLSNWKNGLPQYADFDNAVKALLMATMREKQKNPDTLTNIYPRSK